MRKYLFGKHTFIRIVFDDFCKEIYISANDGGLTLHLGLRGRHIE